MAALRWSFTHEGWVKDQGIGNQTVIQAARLTGYVASIPTVSDTKIQFQFAMDKLNNRSVKSTILLSCFEHCPTFQVGQYWSVNANMRLAKNFNNPGSFDYVHWLSARHLHWLAQAKQGTWQRIPNTINPYPFLSLRQKMAEKLSRLHVSESTLGILQALSLGITTHLKQGQWDLFRRTGTTHLMVISGAHIGLIAALCFSLTKWLWCRMGALCLRIPAPTVGAMIAILMSLCYALLAGFGVPAQRSLLASLFLFARYVLYRRFNQWQAWRYALLVVLLIEPHAVLLPGFYLSFMAVAILILMHQRFRMHGFRQTLCMQIACLFGLMPFTLFWFSYGAVNGFLANLAAIPWVSFVIVPLSLLITLIGQWVEIPLLSSILEYSVAALLYFLHLIDSLDQLNLTLSYAQIIPPLALLLAMGLWLLLPVRQIIPCIFILIFIGLFPKYEQVKQGEVKIDVLDVGQGLAISVRTASHHLIYDTGLKFYRGSDMGKLAIIPYLNSLGIRQLDKVIISHPDLDHRGGLNSLSEKFKIKELIVDDPNFYHKGYACHRHASWNWDGVMFRFFPLTNHLKSKNNTSCVLQIKNQYGAILFSGDIEKQAENDLVTTYGKALKSTMLVVPHHGSKTSSTLTFLKTVDPKYAIFSYGLDNRYHFPHIETIKNYQKQQIELFNTVDCGMVSMVLGKDKRLLKPRCYRR